MVGVPVTSGWIVGQDEVGLDAIQQKVDAIATRLFSRPSNTSFSAGDDTLWQDFKSELEKEGFSPQVLHKHKVPPPHPLTPSNA